MHNQIIVFTFPDILFTFCSQVHWPNELVPYFLHKKINLQSQKA